MYVAVGCRPSRKIQVLDKEPSCPYLEHSNQSILIPAGELSSELEFNTIQITKLIYKFLLNKACSKQDVPVSDLTAMIKLAS